MYLNFYPVEVVSRYRDPQLQQGKTLILVQFEIKHLKIVMFKHTFHSQYHPVLGVRGSNIKTTLRRLIYFKIADVHAALF